MEAEFEKMLQGEFSEPVTFTTGAESVTVQAVYDKTFQMVDPETGATVLSTRPRVTVARSLVPFSIVRTQTLVTARGKTWRVREKQDDDEGSLTIHLD